MPNMLTNILGGIQRIAREFKPWVPEYHTSPPLNRDITVGFALLERVAADGSKVAVGAFLPEHYVLASLKSGGSLRCQVLEREWLVERNAKKLTVTPEDLKKERPDLYAALYREENSKAVRKTAFELAIFPSHNLKKIEQFIEKEYTFLKDRQLPLPAPVSKYRIEPDFLTNLKESGLVIKGVDNRKVNIHNPNPSKREKNLHFAGQIYSIVMTGLAAIAVVEGLIALGVASPFALFAGATAAYLAKKRGGDFGFYDLAESLHRDTLWATSKDFVTGKLSPSKAIITGIYFASILMVTALAVLGAWTGSFALPLAFFSQMGLGANALNAIHIALGVVTAIPAFFYTFVGGVGSTRYFDTFSACDNEIPVTKAMADVLPAKPAVDFKAKLANVQEKLLAKVDKPKYGFSEADRTKLKDEIRATHLGWQNRFGAHPVPVNDTSKEPRRSPRKHSPAK
jgi:hypothetical protein